MNKKRIKQIINKLDPYVAGELITNVFKKYWNELKEQIEKMEKRIAEIDLKESYEFLDGEI